MKGFRKYSEHIIFYLRNSALLITAFLWYLVVQGSLEFSFASAAYIATILIAFILEKNNFRLLPSFLILLVSAVFLRYLTFFIFILFGFGEGYDTSVQFLLFDINLFTVILPCLVLWINNFLSLRYRKYRVIEIFTNIPLFILLFTFLHSKNINPISNIVFGFSLIALFLFINTNLLFVYSQEGNIFSSKTQYLSLALSVIPVTLISFFFLFNFYNEKAKASENSLVHSEISGVDFSNFSDLAPELKQNNDLIFIYKTDDFQQGKLYKRYTFSRYNRKKGFFTQESDNEFLEPTNIVENTIKNPFFNQNNFTQKQEFADTIYSVNLKKNSIVTPENFKKIELLETNNLVNFNYSFKTYYQTKGINKNHKSSIIDLPNNQYYIYLEHDDDGKIKNLTEKVTKDEINIYHKALAISEYLKSNYYYSLRPGLVGDYAIEKFIFETKKGYCTYFANSMAIMCRTIGIPTRVVVGFKLDEFDEVLGLRPVYGYMAHSWVEAYIPESGWISFDPTSDTLALDENHTFKNVNIDEFKKLASQLIQLELEENLKDSSVENTINKKFKLHVSWYFFLPMLYLCVILFTKHVFLFTSFLMKNKRKKTKYRFLHFKYILSSLDIYKLTTETETEYLLRIGKILNIDFHEIDKLYQKALYSREFTNKDYKNYLVLLKQATNLTRSNFKSLSRVFALLKPVGINKRGRK